MDQQELRVLEHRCIQEEAPECTAACPIHLDGRAFVGHVAAGDWKAAWKVLHKTMPFPEILGRICDAPCRRRCKRGQAGDPIQIGDLERVCVATPPPDFRAQRLPRKRETVAVVGSGLSGLTVAWDLARKGYAVRLFEPGSTPGGPLRDLPAERLSEAVIAEAMERLTALGVESFMNVDTEPARFLEQCAAESDAVFLSLESIHARDWDLERDRTGRIIVDPSLQSTSRPGVYAGGRSDTAGPSPVWQAAQGRWAATSIDRFLQRVSPSAGREKDGPYETRLFTSLEGVDPLPQVVAADPGSGYSSAEAVAEAGRCLRCECLECVKVCAYLERFGAYPRKYAREIYNNESIVMGIRQANRLVNSCSLCGLCERVCPEDFAVQDLCLQARRSMVRRGKMPPSAHEFALQDMRFSLSERFRLARHAPGRSQSTHVFYPGCQLCASAPGQVRQVYRHLLDALDGRVGLMLGCCGAPAFWAGREEEFRAVCAGFLEEWSALGKPKIVAACSTCFRVFTEHLPQVPTTSLWPLLEAIGLPPPAATVSGSALAIHDPCTTRPHPAVQDAVRSLVKRLGASAQELTLGRDKTECCGFGGLMQNANPDLAREVVARRARSSPRDFLTYCAMCRDSLAAVGKRALHVLDLAFPDPSVADPAARPRPGWSDRRENRARLRAALAGGLWGEAGDAFQEHRRIRLIIAPEVAEHLDRRRILEEDLRQIIHAAEKSGNVVVHPATGRRKASLRPYLATIWVEYSSSPEGYVVHTAYSHRMEVLGAAPK
ncbi:MAG: heterodisulfide reductase-related iron-sulfur binding cluster [Desulfobacterales bacterium]|jgi:NADPH-dependent glutamate synthase beta subunit-like oxidoreductase|nr:heterodisulfide reductase-related iron-sulfur binding cluster [Desulfobacterales bacterium]